MKINHKTGLVCALLFVCKRKKKKGGEISVFLVNGKLDHVLARQQIQK